MGIQDDIGADNTGARPTRTRYDTANDYKTYLIDRNRGRARDRETETEKERDSGVRWTELN